jgi:hypothetical protein
MAFVIEVKKNKKFFSSTPGWRIRGVNVNLNSFLTSTLDGGEHNVKAWPL